MFQETSGPDLDGDGVAEKVYSFGMPIASEMHVYRGKGPCAHLATVDGSGWLERASDRHEGHHDFVLRENSACEGARCGCTIGQAYTFANGSYREVAAKRVASETKACPGDPQK